jgi:hypothetical protein
MPRKGVFGQPKNKGIKWGEGTFDKAAWMSEYGKKRRQEDPEGERQKKKKYRESAAGKAAETAYRKRVGPNKKRTLTGKLSRSLARKRTRIETQTIARELKAGGCSLCGYRKCTAALEFHHVGEDKEKNVSQVSTKSSLLREASKCIVVCANCHREIHAGQIEGYADVERAEPVREDPPLLQLIHGTA